MTVKNSKYRDPLCSGAEETDRSYGAYYTILFAITNSQPLWGFMPQYALIQ